MQKNFLKCFLVFIILAAVSLNPAYAKKPAKNTRTKTNSAGIASLQGTWTADFATGKGTDARQPGAEITLNAEDIIFTIERIQYSESTGEGRADVIFKCMVSDNRGYNRHERSWEYALPYDVKREAPDTWSFSSDFLDGEDKITIKLKTNNTAELRLEGANWDEVYPEDISTFDVKCDAVKKR